MNFFRRPKPKAPSAAALRHAHFFDSQSGGIRIDDLAPDGDSIHSEEKGAWAGYGRMDFGGGPDIWMAYAAAEAPGRKIEIRIDSPEGEPIGSLTVDSGGMADLFREHYAPILPVRGEHDLYLIFPDGPVGLDWFLFSTNPDRETPEQRAERMRWWREARFGQFVHWGPYSVPARGEWVMYQENIPKEEYELRAAARFDPNRFRARDWVWTLADAGQRYLVVTSKHHDGYSMFETRVRGFEPLRIGRAGDHYSITDLSSRRPDPLRDLARECRRRGVRFGIYYSILDWHHRSQLPVAGGSGLTDMVPGMKERYLSEMKEQLRELVERYDPDLLWFDGDWGGETWWWKAADGQALYRYLRTLKPALIINDRVKRDRGLGDFRTPEQVIPEAPLTGDWESCLTMNDHWGFHAGDQRWKSACELVRDLVDIASKGGNLLLNVGPKADGTLPWETRTRLKEIGRWMQAFGQSVYGSNASPFSAPPSWGRCTAKPGMLFAHVFDWPADRTLRLPAIRNVISGAYPLAGPRSPLSFRRAGDGIEITLPTTAVDPRDTVIVLGVDGTPEAVPGR
jgi:alpha-L-fucosidase